MHAVYFYIQKMEFVKINLTNILIPPSISYESILRVKFCGSDLSKVTHVAWLTGVI